MKKIFFLACAVVTSATLLAGNADLRSNARRDAVLVEPSAKQIAEKVDLNRVANMKIDKASFAKGVKHVKGAAKVDTTINMIGEYFAYYPDAFFPGNLLDGYVYPVGYLIPYNPKGILLASAYGTPGSWTLNDQVVASDTALYILPLGTDLTTYDLPVFKNNNIVKGDTTYAFSDYQFGRVANAPYAEYGFKSHVDNASGWSWMTQSEIYTEVETYDYDYDGTTENTYGENWSRGGARVSATQLVYLYGSGLEIPYSDGNVLFDTVITYVRNSGKMAIEAVAAGIFGLNRSTGYYQAPVVGNMRVTIYPTIQLVDSAGEPYTDIDWEHPYATTTVDSTNYEPYTNTNSGTQYPWGTITASFTEENPLTGTQEEIIVEVDGDFVVAFTELNSSEANEFGFVTDGDVSDPIMTGTYAIGDGGWMTKIWKNPVNILVNFAAVFPVVTDAPEEVELPLEGGQVELTLTTNVEGELMLLEADDEWFDATVSSVMDADGYFTNEVTLQIDAQAATAARTANLTIYALGSEYKIKVIQGEATGINPVKFVNDNKRYNVLGVEVDENYKGVVIKNGEKFLQ